MRGARARAPAGVLAAVTRIVAVPEYVRLCPVCERENAPERARCVCGAALGSVDFTLKAAPRDAQAAAPAPAAAAAAQLREADAQTPICPHADCAQPNPPGRERCVYCNRLLAATPQSAAAASARPLPSALRSDYRVLDAFAASGSEADLLLVQHLASGERCVVKLYRKGLQPDERLLTLLANATGDFVVRVRTFGVSDGVAYEVQEFVPGGTLRDLMAAGPLATSTLRRIVKELADALDGIHAQRIIHRDLKPENVLVRRAEPLELALTDFGIASLREATQHFTGGARTTRYAAPEALTGVLDEKADWWALGMIALECALGRHPFEGLNEQVVSHHLATRPVDVRGVYDDTVRALCRGLLLRDPKRRWGGVEVRRWLAGDATLATPEDADGVASSVRPYRIGQSESTTAAELALALARHWDAAAKDVARGQVLRWVESELHDYNLARKLHDIADERGASDDMRLLRLLLAAAPDLPPMWRGAPVRPDALLAAARKAAGGDTDAVRWLDSIAEDDVLAHFAKAGQHALGELDQRWRDAWSHFIDVWRAAQAAEEAWRKSPRAIGGLESARVASFDDLMFSAPQWLAPPPRAAVNGALLLVLTADDFAAAVQGEVIAGRAGLAGFCPWFDALCARVARDPVGMLVARAMLPQAHDDAAVERRRQGATAEARARLVVQTREQLRGELQALQQMSAPARAFDHETTAELLTAVQRFQDSCRHALGVKSAEPEYETLCRGIEKLAGHALAAQQALLETEAVHARTAIIMRPDRLAMGAVIVVAVFALWAPWMIAVCAGLAAGVLGYRWYLGGEATRAARRALHWLQLHAKVLG